MFPKIGVHQNGWFIRESHIFGNTHFENGGGLRFQLSDIEGCGLAPLMGSEIPKANQGVDV